MDKTILSFKHQTTGAQGLLVTANGFAIHDIAIEDTPGDALKVLGGTGVTIQRVRVEWTDGPNANNGSYGLYPVQCTNVLLDEQRREGRIGLRRLRRPVRHDPRHQQRRRGQRRRHRDRELDARRRPRQHRDQEHRRHPRVQPARPRRSRTAPARACSTTWCSTTTRRTSRRAGNIVGLVPTGTGIAVLAAHDVEIFGNTVHDHDIGQRRHHQLRADDDRGHRSDVRPVPDRDLHPRQHARGHERRCRPASSARC